MLERRQLLLGSAAGLMSVAAEGAQAPQTVLLGEYEGGFGARSNFTAVSLALSQGRGGLAGTATLTFDDPTPRPLARIESLADRVRFRLADVEYDLRANGTGLSGIARGPRGAEPAGFARRDERYSRERFTPLAGNYDLGPDGSVTLALNSSARYLIYRRWPDGGMGVLWPETADRFVSGPGLLIIEPVVLRVEAVRSADGSVAALRWSERGEPARLAPRISPYREEEVSFTSGEVSLRGSLLLPHGPGPHPGVVLVHGSGGQNRDGSVALIRMMGDAYARSGVATLIYDKRGTGRSTGAWQDADFEQLAGDAAQGVKLLRSRPEVRRNFVGVSGVSQAAWIMALVTRMVPDVRFVVMQSGAGAGITVDVQERRRIELQMRADGYPQAQITRALRLRDLRDAYARTGAGWAALAAYYQQVKNEPWIRYQGELEAPDDRTWAWLRKAFSYVPRELWSRYRGSVLALFGTLDTLTPVAETRASLEQALIEGGNPDHTVLTVPGATHDFFLGRTGGDREFPAIRSLVPGYYPLITQWVLSRVGLPAEISA